MPRALRLSLLSARDMFVTAGPFIVLTLVLLAVAYVALDPTPPRTVVLATGVEQGAYAEFGQRYAALLKEHGIRVQLRTTAGAAENMRLLRDPASGVDLAFMQGGADPHDKQGENDDIDANLVSLGSLFYEPVWVFYREESAQRLLGTPTLSTVSELSKMHLNIGAPGSGVPHLMHRFFDANRIDESGLQLSRLPPTPAVVDLLEGRLDALAMASAPEALMVQMLLQTPGIKLLDFAQSEAYARRFPFMSPVVLPRGVVDLARDIPSSDVHLVAPTATLIARADLHPALMQLFVQAAHTVHDGAGWFQHRGDFPNARNTELPLAREAQRYFQSGPPLLQRYLPFWLANLIDRMWVVLVSIIAALIPLSRVVPPLYELRIRSRIFRWYGQLREIEQRLDEPRDSASTLIDELAALDAKVEQITVPLSHADELYALRSHIEMVRKKLT